MARTLWGAVKQVSVPALTVSIAAACGHAAEELPAVGGSGGLPSSGGAAGTNPEGWGGNDTGAAAGRAGHGGDANTLSGFGGQGGFGGGGGLGGVPTSPPPAQPDCSEAACRDVSLCFEASGQSCRCPTEPLEGCASLPFQTLPFVDGREVCAAYQTNADGSSVVGACTTFHTTLPVTSTLRLRWTPSAGAVEILADVLSAAGASLSEDGARLLWSDQTAQGFERVFLRQLDDPVSVDVRIESPFGDLSHVFAMGQTRDLRVVVGTFSDAEGRNQPFRWSAGTGLIAFPPSIYGGVAYGVSDDGAVVVGFDGNELGRQTAREWRADGGVRALALPDGVSGALAFATNADGSVSVGYSFDPVQALRWTAAGVEVIGGSGTTATLVSDDGQRVFGDDRERAWMWDAANGLRPLEDIFTQAGAFDPDWLIQRVNAASRDGKTIVGVARKRSEPPALRRTYAFRAHLPDP